jgi:hypothetical protein
LDSDAACTTGDCLAVQTSSSHVESRWFSCTAASGIGIGYDFSKLDPGIRGKYYKRLVGRPIIVELRPDPDKPKPKKARKRAARRASRAK